MGAADGDLEGLTLCVPDGLEVGAGLTVGLPVGELLG